MLTKEQMLNLLTADVVPALGCTEPVCVALCAAAAGQGLAGEPLKITVEANNGIYKNGMSAGIPNCHKVGLDYAAALGAYLQNPEKSLQLLEDITGEILTKAESLVQSGGVQVMLASGQEGLYVKCSLVTTEGSAVCIIRNAHTNIVYLEQNGKVLMEESETAPSGSDQSLVTELLTMTIAQIRALVDSASEEELRFLLDGENMNRTLAAYSQSNPTGVGIADAFRKEAGGSLLSGDLMSRILIQVSSAAESRLDGCPLPTMSSSGAGTKGLVVILPVCEAADVLGVSVERRVKALALAHLINRYINAHIGKLSPMCSCVMASSTAASAGITYLLGGSDEQIGHAIRNMSGTVTGMICDGGKVGCALKVSAGSAAALMSAITAIHHAPLRVSDGICGDSPEDCIRNMARIGIHGMSQADREIINIMLEK